MTRPSPDRVDALLRAQFPGSDISVTRVPGGIRIEMHGDASSMFAIIGDEPSAILAALEPFPQDVP